MGRYYLRIEGINVGWFIYDTQDLSTIRGGSQLLNHAIKWVPEVQPTLIPVTVGASAGIFEFDVENDSAANQVCHDLLTGLRAKNAALQHATFVVDFQRATENFANDREALLAQNRHRQMCAPTIAVPRTQDGLVCELDGVRPATGTTWRGGIKRAVSTSVFARREYGKQQKKAMIRNAAGKPLEICDELEELSAKPSFRNLNRKIAVLFLDGNSFGKIQSDLCRTPEDQHRFDQQLRQNGERILRALVASAEANDKNWFTDDGKLRLEALMLAGDEIRLVVPAWCGWDALAEIFRTVKGGAFTAKVNGGEITRPLTYKAGLVFCHHNAPIQRVLDLAGSLAGFAKKNWSARLNGGNVLAYQVMESFDFVARDFEKFREERCVGDSRREDQVLGGEEMEEIAKLVQHVRRTFPSNKLHEGVRLLAEGSVEGARDLWQEELNKLPTGDATTIKARAVMISDAFWMHCLDLADYVAKKEAVHG